MACLAGTAWANNKQVVCITNYSNCPYNYGDPTLWNDPTATRGGALWIDIGNGPVLNGQFDVNVQLDCNAPDGHGGFAWVTLGKILLSDGSAEGDVTWMGSDCVGMFFEIDGTQYDIPNTDLETGPYSFYWMRLYFWTGTENSYAEAAEAHEYLGDSGEFRQAVGIGALSFPAEMTAMPATIMTGPLAGDANYDNRVDINDLTRVLTNYNQSTGVNWSTGDFNRDGKVDINDLTIVLANYNHNRGAPAMTAVPEPASLVLAAVGALGLLVYARRKRK
jgi:hypothetical protein